MADMEGYTNLKGLKCISDGHVVLDADALPNPEELVDDEAVELATRIIKERQGGQPDGSNTIQRSW